MSADSSESIPNMIVIISRPYTRPIVRVKENIIEAGFTLKGRTGKNEIMNATKRELSIARAMALSSSLFTQQIRSTLQDEILRKLLLQLVFYAWNITLREW